MMIQKSFKVVALLAGALMLNSGSAMAEESFGDWMLTFSHSCGVNPVSNRQYKEECGSCHFAYQPGLLPGKSWEKLLTAQALHDHFGEVADLDKGTLDAIRDYVSANAADKSYYKVARKIAVATEDGEAPLRITDVRFIKRKHHDLPENMVKGNKDVKSLSYCDACHTQASKGIYSEDTVSIPNFPDY
jgi:Dihaem cytochrome c